MSNAGLSISLQNPDLDRGLLDWCTYPFFFSSFLFYSVPTKSYCFQYRLGPYRNKKRFTGFGLETGDPQLVTSTSMYSFLERKISNPTRLHLFVPETRCNEVQNGTNQTKFGRDLACDNLYSRLCTMSTLKRFLNVLQSD